jgi:hypothetical protein
VAAAHHGQGRPLQGAQIALGKQQQGRVGGIQQGQRVGGIGQAQQVVAVLLGPGQGGVHLRVQVCRGLRPGGGVSQAQHIGPHTGRGVPDGLGAAECGQQATGLQQAQLGGEQQAQPGLQLGAVQGGGHGAPLIE